MGTSSGLGQERGVLRGSCSRSFSRKLWGRAPSCASQRPTVELPQHPGLAQSHGPPNPELSIPASPSDLSRAQPLVPFGVLGGFSAPLS